MEEKVKYGSKHFNHEMHSELKTILKIKQNELIRMQLPPFKSKTAAVTVHHHTVTIYQCYTLRFFTNRKV